MQLNAAQLYPTVLMLFQIKCLDTCKSTNSKITSLLCTYWSRDMLMRPSPTSSPVSLTVIREVTTVGSPTEFLYPETDFLKVTVREVNKISNFLNISLSALNFNFVILKEFELPLIHRNGMTKSSINLSWVYFVSCNGS